MLIYFWLLMVFVVGAVVGSFLNVAIARLPLEKSLLWPGSRCGTCYQPVPWYHNLPLISYLLLRGRCRVCGARFSIRYFLVELVTALAFVGLFYLEVVQNIHGWPASNPWAVRQGLFPAAWWIGFVYHAILVSFLIVAAACDLDGREIPLGLTLVGTVVGLIGAVLFPWPWPWPVELAGPQAPAPWMGVRHAWMDPGIPLATGLYPWPFWGPLPDWAAPGGNWQTGLATGLIGALVGGFFLRGIRYLFSTGLGKEALGLGDADLMMMAGAFLGWQPVVAAFFVSVVPGLIFGLAQLAIRRENAFPFGPALSAGVVITFLGWGWIGPYVRPLFFFGTLLLVLAVAAGLFMLISSFVIRLLKGTSSEQLPGTDAK